MINRHPAVRMSLVSARKNPITGAVVSAEVVLAKPEDNLDASAVETAKAEILQACRGGLAAHKVPASIRFTSALAMSPSGKLVRRNG